MSDKPKLYICNSFSLSMLDREVIYQDYDGEVTLEVVTSPHNIISFARAAGKEIISAVGHADTAALFSTLLEMPVPHNRITVKLRYNIDTALIGQYVGPRLSEGCTTLPEGARIEWWIV